MKRPYLTQFERLTIYAGTLIGDLAMFRFRWKQLLRDIYNKYISNCNHKMRAFKTKDYQERSFRYLCCGCGEVVYEDLD